jgi:uncharacterized membrane protein (UPF0182 family)
MPPPRTSRFRGRGRAFIVISVATAIILLLSLRGIASFYTDYLWFDALGRSDVWRQVLGAKIALTLIFGGAFFVLMWINLMIADRLAPPFRPAGPEEELLARYHEVMEGRQLVVRSATSFLFALIAAAGVSSHWEEWLLFVNRKDFGIDDPLFNTDVGFYVFELPFLSFVVSWAFAAFVIIFIITAIAHYLNGGIRIQAAGPERVTPQVKVHLSVILAVLAVIKAVDYYLARFELTVSTRGVVDGALYTDVKAKLPALNLLMLISMFAVVLLMVNIRRRGWVLPVLAVGLWAFVAIVMGSIYPAFVQRFRVDPNETSREAGYTTSNIEATRDAFGLNPDSDVDLQVYDYTAGLTADQIRASELTIRNARLLDPATVNDTFDREQGEREFYSFASTLDTDRYMVDGRLTQVVIAARELNLTELGSWEREHVAITHGYGVAVAPANVTTAPGGPAYVVGGLPVTVDNQIQLSIEQPQIYHGEGLSGYALVGATRDEVDYVDGNNQDVAFRYDGDGGVGMGSFIRQAAFALRFAEFDPLISNFVDGDTRIIYVRDIRDRVEKLAPFLEFDGDAYPVVVDDRLHYVIDAFTTTSRYPYSQQADGRGLIRSSDLDGKRFNYIRNSVKVVVDAYDGDVTLYRMPIDDPIIDAWRDAFPGLITDFDEMPAGLREHLRYPQDLFTVQTNMWASYQVNEPEALIIGTERWAVAQDPGRSVGAGGLTESVVDESTGSVSSSEVRVSPYYTLIELPGEDTASFVTLRSFVPTSDDDSRKELTAFMVAETLSNGESRLVSYKMSNLLAPGPAIVASAISTNSDISSRLTLLNDQGSTVVFGDLLLLPIADSILYVRPLYVKAQGNPPIPLIRHVIAVAGDRTVMGDDLPHALSLLFPGEDFSDVVGAPIRDDGSTITPEPDDPDAPEDPDAPDDPDAPPPDTPPLDAAELLAALAELRAQQDDLAEAQSETNANIDMLIEQLLALLGVEPTPEPEAGSEEVEA